MSNFMVALVYVIARLKEPSTYAGLMGLAAAYHIPHADQLVPQLITLFMAAASIAAIFLPEKSRG